MPYIKDYIWITLIAFGTSVLLTPFVRKKSQQSKQALDFPDRARKIHAVPIPRLGGIAIYVAFFVALLPAFLGSGPTQKLFHAHIDVFMSLLLTSSLIFLIGLYDDFRGASVSQKLTVQTIAAILAYVGGFNVEVLSIPFVGSVPLGILGLPVTLFWFVGVTNALNFIDGVDGLACGVGFFSISTIFGISLFLHHPLTAFFAAALAGGLFGFAIYNFNPASIFMGDSGSLFVGFIIAAISLQGAQKSSTAVVLLLPVIVLGVPIADTLLAIIRRLGNGRSPFSADKDHIHHRLLNMGFSSRQVVVLLYVVCSLLGIIALLMTAVTNQMLTLLLIILSSMTIGGLKMLGYTTDMIALNSLVRERIQKRRQLLQRQKLAEILLAEIASAVDKQTLQKAIIKYFENIEVDFGIVRATRQKTKFHAEERGRVAEEAEELLIFTWRSPQYEYRDGPIREIWEITLPIFLNGQASGEFRVGKYWWDDDQWVDDLLFSNSLRHSLEKALLRLFPL